MGCDGAPGMTCGFLHPKAGVGGMAMGQGTCPVPGAGARKAEHRRALGPGHWTGWAPGHAIVRDDGAGHGHAWQREQRGELSPSRRHSQGPCSPFPFSAPGQGGRSPILQRRVLSSKPLPGLSPLKSSLQPLRHQARWTAGIDISETTPWGTPPLFMTVRWERATSHSVHAGLPAPQGSHGCAR